MGRPVHFVDDDAEGDARAEATLAEVAHQVGFREVSFQYEPVAAALAYEQAVERETLALIADLGGGTADFTLVRLGPARRKAADRAADLLANDGVRIGGTDYDQRLAMASVMPALGFGSRMARGDIDVPGGPYWDLATWSQVNRLYDAEGDLADSLDPARRRTAGAGRAPAARHRGAARPRHPDGGGGGQDRALRRGARRDRPLLAGGGACRRGHPRRLRGLDRPPHRRALPTPCGAAFGRRGLRRSDVDALFFTGGTSAIPAVRATIRGLVPQAAVVDGDRFGAVGTGLAVEAQRRYG